MKGSFAPTGSPRWRQRSLVVATSVALVASTAACTTVASSSPQNSVTVKALWYAGSDQSTRQGIANVTLALGIDDRGDAFDLDLDTERAQGAGPAWTAATWSAASVATLFSFHDPRTVELSVAIGGAIDGPSAGGLMAAAMLAMSADMELRSDTTMTGTINPDGSIGMVGGVPAKLRAASEAGIQKLLVPAGSTMSIDPSTGDEVNVVEQGQQLGVEVVEVASLLEALAHMTGREAEFDAGFKESPPISKQVLAAVSGGAKQLAVMSAAQRDAARKAGLASRQIRQAERSAARGTAALRAGRPSDAYAQLSRTYYSLAQQISAKQTASIVRSDGVDSARQQLLRQVDELEQVNAGNGASTAGLSAANVQQMIGLPDALTWATDPEIDLDIYRGQLTAVPATDRELERIAEGVADARTQTEISLGQVTDVLMASGGTPADQDAVARALTAYTDFLTQSGDASLNYYESVLARLDDQAAKNDHKVARHAYAVADSMRTQLSSAPGEGAKDLPQQRIALSRAVSYYIATSELVVQTEILRVASADPDGRDLTITNEPGFANAVTSSAYVNGSLLEILADEGTDSSYAHWNVDWARWKIADSHGKSGDTERLHGLSMSWHASVQLLLLSSAPIQQLSQAAVQVSPG